MLVQPTYDELERKVRELRQRVAECEQIDKLLDKEKYYLDEAQKIGNMGTWDYDAREDRLYWTPQLYKIFEVSEDTPLSLDKVFSLIILPEDREFLRSHWEAAVRGTPYDVEHRILADGKIKWLREKCTVETAPDGSMIRAIGICQDVTYRKEAETKLEFFREATSRICGTLDIEQGLGKCFELLEQHMPADVIYLQQFEEDMFAMRLLASARKNSCEYLDTLVRLPEVGKETMADIQRKIAEKTIDDVIVINRSDELPMTKYVLELLGHPPSSALSLPLMIGDACVGALDLFAHGEDRFTEEQIRLFATLREPMALAMVNAMKHRELVRLKNLLADDNRYLHRELRRLSGDEIIGANFGFRAVMEKAGRVAPIDSPVLLLGETGTGKDVVANAIHYSSPRSDGPFVKINCGAIPDTLIDSELFGHEKGAFTGAINRKRGCFERAHQGTVFLDEIGELPLQAQVRLLRVLQDKEIQRVGGDTTITLDVRVIAATNRNLEQMVKDGSFREDLWFRLNVFPIYLPPLRERTSDIPALVRHFVESKAADLKLPAVPRIAPHAVDVLMNYDWPGNVRELANIVERALILNPQGPVNFESLGSAQPHASTHQPEIKPLSLNLDDAMTDHIQRAIKKANGKIHGSGGAAELLGMNPNTLRSRMKKLGISVSQ